MTRARAFVAAVPQRVWTAVAGLALLASLAIAAVIGAGLQVWRSAIGSAAQPPSATVEPPGSGLIVLPGGQTVRPPVPTHQAPPPIFAVSAPVTPAGSGGARAVAAPPAAAGTDTDTTTGFTPRGHARGLDAGGALDELVGLHGQPAGHFTSLVVMLDGEKIRVPAPLAARIAAIENAAAGSEAAEPRWLSAHEQHLLAQAHRHAARHAKATGGQHAKGAGRHHARHARHG